MLSEKSVCVEAASSVTVVSNIVSVTGSTVVVAEKTNVADGMVTVVCSIKFCVNKVVVVVVKDISKNVKERFSVVVCRKVVEVEVVERVVEVVVVKREKTVVKTVEVVRAVRKLKDKLVNT